MRAMCMPPGLLYFREWNDDETTRVLSEAMDSIDAPIIGMLRKNGVRADPFVVFYFWQSLSPSRVEGQNAVSRFVSFLSRNSSSLPGKIVALGFN
jgi:hypothetical protein